MRPETRMLLRDMLDAGLAIQQFLMDKSVDDLKRDDLLRSAIYIQVRGDR